ncbi:MAG: hypothetical protein RR296_01090 [Clostridia bacterium]
MNEDEKTEAQDQGAVVPAETTETQAPAAQAVEEKSQAATATTEPEKPADTQTPDELTAARGQLTKALELALNAEARAAAAGLGVRADRVRYTVKLADLSGIDLGKEGACEKVSAAISKVLEVMPELKGGAGTGSLGNPPRQQLTPQDTAVQEFRRGLNG